jgi:hypothetical protein
MRLCVGGYSTRNLTTLARPSEFPQIPSTGAQVRNPFHYYPTVRPGGFLSLFVRSYPTLRFIPVLPSRRPGCFRLRFLPFTLRMRLRQTDFRCVLEV